MNLHSLQTPLNELVSVTAASKDAAFLVPSLPTGVHRIITALLHYHSITAVYWAQCTAGQVIGVQWP